MKPYFERGGIVLYHGDALTIAPSLSGVDAVISDPPYGMNWDTDTTRFSGGAPCSQARRGSGRKSPRVANDAEPFDPSPWLDYPRVVLFGANHYASRLPVGTSLLWLKRLDSAFGSFLSDAEIAWMKGGCGVYCHRDLSMYGEAKNREHPCQKPVGVMAWCIERAKVPDGGTILDPFSGSGSTLLAAYRMERHAIGIELDEAYCETAAKRLEREMAQGDLFRKAAP
jgi:DNA modification methylase